jgi:Protein of unknown function (DUF3768)
VSHESDQSKRIRELNDKLRTTFTGGDVLNTVGIDALSSDVQASILEKVRTFSEFSEENDPCGEHDYGSFQIAGHHVMWKIDYYDERLEGHSEDAADPTKTRRVLTILLASEY